MTRARLAALACGATMLCGTWTLTPAIAQAPPSGSGGPNIIVIMGDDIGWNNIGSTTKA